MILGGSASTEDEMSTRPDQDEGYGPLDGLLEEIAAEVRGESRVRGDRRPGMPIVD
jgi:hypothetical protein